MTEDMERLLFMTKNGFFMTLRCFIELSMFLTKNSKLTPVFEKCFEVSAKASEFSHEKLSS